MSKKEQVKVSKALPQILRESKNAAAMDHAVPIPVVQSTLRRFLIITSLLELPVVEKHAV